MMFNGNAEEIKEKIIQKAKEFGACGAGIAGVNALKQSTSHIIYAKISDYKTVGNKEGQVAPGEVSWPADAKSAIIVAVGHAETKPEMDWWIESYYGRTPGNRKLIEINDKLALWLENETGIKATKLAYHIEYGGILLKDAAVLAGLGCLGKNNMLVTPEYGPRVRIRAMFTDVALPGTGPIDFDPCEDCDMPCRTACPQEAFAHTIFSKKDLGISQLPARSGVYSRPLCNRQMVLDSSNNLSIRIEGQDAIRKATHYCRLCEFACPVGHRKKHIES
jgi:epoxyqueuosine reductase